MEDWSRLDMQMQRYSPRLQDDLMIGREESNRLASTIALEVSKLDREVREEILQGSIVPLKERIEELAAFQAWMDLVNSLPTHPAMVRAQVVVQNYICFVYLGESCFTVMKKYLPTDSSTKKCCVFLTNNPVRAFRNAMAHGNWKYKDDFSALGFWARKGSEPQEPVACWEVSQLELDFWQALARCTAYVAFSTLDDH